MSFAAAAGNFGARDAEGAVGFLGDIFFGDGLIEAGPAGAGIEFGRGVKKSSVTADAAEYAGRVIVGIFVGVGALGAFAARDFVGVGGKLFAPVGVGFDNRLDGNFFFAGSGVGKFDDGHGFWDWWWGGGFGAGGIVASQEPPNEAGRSGDRQR